MLLSRKAAIKCLLIAQRSNLSTERCFTLCLMGFLLLRTTSNKNKDKRITDKEDLTVVASLKWKLTRLSVYSDKYCLPAKINIFLNMLLTEKYLQNLSFKSNGTNLGILRSVFGHESVNIASNYYCAHYCFSLSCHHTFPIVMKVLILPATITVHTIVFLCLVIILFPLL